MDEDRSSRLLLRERENFGERYAEVKAWAVPESERYPDGVKYSFQYGEIDGNTIFRYDNFPDHPDASKHHKHTDDDVEAIEFEGIEALYERFKNEVIDNGHDWH